MSKGGKKGGKGGLQGDLVKMMYGYGDEKRPRQDSVDLLESMVQEYIFEMCRQAYDNTVGDNDVNQEAVMFSISKDLRRFGRLKEILTADQELKDARDPKVRKLAEADDQRQPQPPVGGQPPRR